MTQNNVNFLQANEPFFQTLLSRLEPEFDYVSILAKDVDGVQLVTTKHVKRIQDHRLNQRGFVVRVYKDNGYYEYSSNIFDADTVVGDILRDYPLLHTVEEDCHLEKLPSSILSHEKGEKEEIKEPKISFKDADLNALITRMSDAVEKISSEDSHIVEAQCVFSMIESQSLFMTKDATYYQSLPFAEGSCFAMAHKDGLNKMDGTMFSGIGGAKVLDTMDISHVASDTMQLFDAGTVKPGLYDIITTPEISGLIAHEAFGHGVEMDMFVKNRALAKDFIGDKIASDVTNMFDGALSEQSCGTYLFDDEGTLGTSTQILTDGVLSSGISDALSASRLNTTPTGNGRRESYKRKAYTRMTNTFFAPGNDSLEDMISSISFGYLVEGMESGMEDPKHWGIQCIARKGYEIKDGVLTGKIVSPIILTGYVPDLLASISMCSKEVEMLGNGYCGKGHKEWVKTSTGGPYIKCKARLG